ncbi:MAG: TldD/PmbA family protein [Thermoplasmataceae archaeon]
MIDLQELFRLISESGFNEIALNLKKIRTKQIRFSNSTKDLSSFWEETQVDIFAASGRKYVSTVLKDMESSNSVIEYMRDQVRRIPESQSFLGINPEAQAYRINSPGKIPTIDEHDAASEMIKAATDSGAERSAGVIYRREEEVEVLTNYNHHSYTTGGYEAVIRSFRGSRTGQEGRHFGPNSSLTSKNFTDIGSESALHLKDDIPQRDIAPGTYDIIMSPYVLGNLLSYSSGFFSYYSVETGMSCFSGKLNERVGSELLSLKDDPLDANGIGFRIFDDEGTATQPNYLIREGILKSYAHSYSTARRAGAKTTGNAGIIYPVPFQLEMEQGTRSLESIISEVRHGLLINNAWYTRFQDYRNGVFSTVPRDGVFIVENGDLAGVGSGIRISDSIPHILMSLKEISRETKYVKWWEEIFPSRSPYALAEGINISRSFS